MLTILNATPTLLLQLQAIQIIMKIGNLKKCKYSGDSTRTYIYIN